MPHYEGVDRAAAQAPRRSELLAAWSVAIDVAIAAPMESGIRTALVATRLAEAAGAPEDELFRAYHVALLRHIGCTAANREFAAILGDELAFRRTVADADLTSVGQMLPRMIRTVTASRSLAGRPLAVLGLLARLRGMTATADATCEVAQMLTDRLGLGAGVRRDLVQVYERHDGRGFPNRLPGAEISLPAHTVQIAESMVVHDQLDGPAAAARMLQTRRGGAIRPDLADLAVRHLGDLLAAPAGSVWDTVIDAEPGPAPRLAPGAVDELLRALGDFVDLKSPYTVGHSAEVARLAGDAATVAGLTADAARQLRRAGWVHDLGRVAVALPVWEKRAALTRDEWESIRLHPYYTDRILHRPPLLAALGSLAAAHHERLDGSGYHTGATAAALPFAARILAVADTLSTLVAERPHRPALSPDDAARSLRSQARAGRLDSDAVEAVLAASGQGPRARRAAVCGLTAREVDVLGLLALGRSNAEIARELVISPKTVSRHVEGIYAKAGVRTRAGATMFAMRHGLVSTRLG